MNFKKIAYYIVLESGFRPDGICHNTACKRKIKVYQQVRLMREGKPYFFGLCKECIRLLGKKKELLFDEVIIRGR